MIVTIPVIGILGFGLLTSVKHAPVGSVAPGSRPYLAAPEIAAGPPAVELKHAAAAPCAAGTTALPAGKPCAAQAPAPTPEPPVVH